MVEQKLADTPQRGAGAAVLLAAALLVPLLYLTPFSAGRVRPELANAIFLVLSAGAALACFWAGRRQRATRQPWNWFGAGCLAWFVGSLIWAWYDLAAAGPPFPSVADGAYLL